MNKIKLLFIALFLCFTSQNSQGQSVNRLNEKMGFDIFKLEQPISKYIKDLKAINTTDNIITYQYKGSNSKQLFDVKIKSLNITTFKGYLYNISINFDIEKNVESDMILQSLIGLYGDYEPSPFAGLVGYQGYVWQSDKVSLIFSTRENNNQIYAATISIRSLKLERDKFGEGL